MNIYQMQCLLSFHGYDTGGIDGVWGKKTSQAIQDFQNDFGELKSTAEPNEPTWKLLARSILYSLEARETPEASFWDSIPNFSRREFACKCGQYCDGYPAEPQEAMVRIAQAARDHFGKPALVVSGLRCPQHNADVGGVANSQHMAGEACDLTVPGVSGAELLAFLRSQSGVRYAYQINETNVHFDIPRGESQWNP